MRILFLVLLMVVSAAHGRQDKGLAIEFPDRVGDWSYSDYREYEPAALGWSHSYKPKGGGLGAITIYVYDRGRTDIGTGLTPAVKEEMAEVYATVRYAWELQKARVEEIQAPSEIAGADGKPVGMYSLHRLTVDSARNVSISGLMAYRGHFLKLRYTYPGHDTDKAQKHLRSFLELLLKQNRDATPPLPQFEEASKPSESESGS